MAGPAAGLIAAMLAQAAIALVLLALLGSIRLPLVGSGAIRVTDIALSRDPWPVREKQVSNAFDNQFQLPVLLYASGALALYFGATAFEAIVAWAFVVSRIVHAAIFVTSNNVRHRFAAYTAGYAGLIVFWADLAVRLALAVSHGP